MTPSANMIDLLLPSRAMSAAAGSDTTKYAMKNANCVSIASAYDKLEDRLERRDQRIDRHGDEAPHEEQCGHRRKTRTHAFVVRVHRDPSECGNL